MSLLTGIARLGKDAEIRYSQEGKPITTLALAFSYGKKDPQTGKRQTQWVDAAWFGEQGAKVAPYLLKGNLVNVFLKDVHVETFTKSDGSQGHKLSAFVQEVELTGSANQGQAQQPQQYQSQQQQRQPQQFKPQQPPSFDDMNDDIPFN